LEIEGEKGALDFGGIIKGNLLITPEVFPLKLTTKNS
jgi:hypothetical protein